MHMMTRPKHTFTQFPPLFGGLGLMFLGLLIVIGPKWHNNFIHISLTNGHGITTQDVVALVPIFAGMLWLGIGIWLHREILRQRVRQYPEGAILAAVCIGLGIGITVGVLMGTVFENDVFRWLEH